MTIENPMLQEKAVKFKKVTHDGQEIYQVDIPLLHLDWPKDDGGQTDIHFDYPGENAFLFIPFKKLFEPVGGSDQIFKLKKNGKNKLRLLPRGKIPHPTDGSLRFSYAIYDLDLGTFAIGNSPPDMLLGP